MIFDHLVWLAPVAVGIAAWRAPRGGLLVLAAALPSFGLTPGGPYRGALDMAALLAIVGALRAPRAEPSRLASAAVAFVLASAASALPLAYLPPSLQPALLVRLAGALAEAQVWSGLYTWRALLDLLIGWGLFVAVRRNFDRRSSRDLGLAIGVGLGATLGLGLGEALGWIDLGRYRSWPTEPWLLTRVSALFFDSGWLAEYLVVATPIAVAALGSGGRRARALGTILAVGAVACLALTEQRGGWIAGAAEITVLLGLLAWRRDRRAVRACGVALAAIVLIVASLLALSAERRASLAARAEVASWKAAERGDLWLAALAMIRDRPLSGVGLGAWAPSYDRLHPRGSSTAHPSRSEAHQTYLHLAAETGVLGLAAFLLLLATAARSAFDAGRESELGPSRFADGLLLALVGVTVYGLVQHVLFVAGIAWLLWMVLALVARLEFPARFRWRSAVGLLAAFAIASVPFRLTALERPALPGDRSFGFHEPEAGTDGRAYAWTEGYAARRLTVAGSALIVALANGHPRPEQHPVRVEVRLGHGPPAAATLATAEWTELVVAAPGFAASEALLQITAEPTFRPYRATYDDPTIARSQDPRRLGVAVGEMRWESAPEAERSDAVSAQDPPNRSTQNDEVEP